MILKALGFYKHSTLQSKLQSNTIPSHGAPLTHSLMTMQQISADSKRFIATTKSFLLPLTSHGVTTSQHRKLPCFNLEV